MLDHAAGIGRMIGFMVKTEARARASVFVVLAISAADYAARESVRGRGWGVRHRGDTRNFRRINPGSRTLCRTRPTSRRRSNLARPSVLTRPWSRRGCRKTPQTSSVV